MDLKLSGAKEMLVGPLRVALSWAHGQSLSLLGPLTLHHPFGLHSYFALWETSES
jgi:hypothetical protein